MNKKKLFLMTLLFVLATVFAVGCSKFESQIDPDVHKCVVIVHANGGRMNNLEVRTFNMQEGSVIPVPKKNSTIPVPARDKYSLVGYYRVELDENNNIVRDESGDIIWGEEWDFQWDRLEGNVNIAVKWERNVTYEFVEGTLYSGEKLPEDFALTNQEGTLVKSVSANNSIAAPSGSDVPKAEGYTLVGYYKDAACTQRITLPYSMTAEEVDSFRVNLAEDEEYNVPIYTKWLEGNYTIVSKASDLSSFGGSVNYFFDAAEIDMTGSFLSFGSSYSGEIVGNGCVIKNLSINLTQARGNADYSAMFRNLIGAKISGLTFKDLVVDFLVKFNPEESGYARNEYANISLLYSSKDADTVISDVVFDNALLKVTHESNKNVFDPDTGVLIGKEPNDYKCNVVYYAFGKDSNDIIGSIDNAHEAQQITFSTQQNG